MSSRSQVQFVKQQGFPQAEPSGCAVAYGALMFQPRLIGIIMAVGLVVQAWPLFLALSAALWWSALVPSRNLFEVLYNAAIAGPRGLPPAPPAPPPRRFAQGLAAAFTLATGLSLLGGHRTLAWVFEGIFAAALVALIFGRFCVGSYLYHVLTGNREYARRTLPWAKREAP